MKCKYCNGSGVLHRIIDTGMMTYEPCHFCKKVIKKSTTARSQVKKKEHPSLFVH